MITLGVDDYLCLQGEQSLCLLNGKQLFVQTVWYLIFKCLQTSAVVALCPYSLPSCYCLINKSHITECIVNVNYCLQSFSNT